MFRKIISGGMLAFGVLALAGASHGSVVVDGYVWDYAYTGDAMPEVSSPAWTRTGTPTSASVNGTGQLTMDSTGGNYFDYSLPTGSEWAPGANKNTGQTTWIQFKMKVNSQAIQSNLHAFGVIGARSDLGFKLFFGDRNSVGVDGADYNQIVDVDVYQEHTYRVEFAPTTYTLWVDDFNTPAYTGNLFGVGSRHDTLLFGPLDEETSGSATLDYIAWNNSTAPVAVPEPSILGLFGAITLMALNRHRRT